MRALFVSTPGVGHLLPLLPLARAVSERGHDVRVAVGAGLAPILATAGFDHVAVGPPALADIVPEIPEMHGLTGRRRAVTMVRHGFSDRIASWIADDLAALIPTWRPDLIVHEDLEVGSWLVAERVGIPHVTVQATAWRPLVRELIGEAQTALRDQHRLAHVDPINGPIGRLFLATRPRGLQDPDAPLPSVTEPMRPVAADEFDPAAAGFGGGDPFPERNGRRRVALTLGTVNHGELELLRALIDGAVAAGADVVVALGGDPATLGPVPRRVRVLAYVPMSRLLPAADVVGFHGGSGTFVAAMAVGTPVVMVPIAADQLDNADRCVAVGVGRVVARGEADAASLRRAFEDVLGNSAYRERATGVAADIAAMPRPAAVVDRLEEIARGE